MDSGSSDDWAYAWDAWGSLKQVTLPNSDVVDYVTDGLNRRIAKLVNSTLERRYIYQDGLRLVAEIDGSGNVNHFVYGSRANVPDYMIRTVGGTATNYRIISDHLGSVRLVVKASDGTIAQRLDYNEYGLVLNDTNPGFQAFGYAGGMYDPSTKLTHFGAREYDAQIARWMSKDPIGFSGGDTNLFGYVLADPINGVDQTGLTIAFTDQRLKDSFEALMKNPKLDPIAKLKLENLQKPGFLVTVGQGSSARRDALSAQHGGDTIYAATDPTEYGAKIEMFSVSQGPFGESTLLHELIHASQAKAGAKNLGTKPLEDEAYYYSDGYLKACRGW